MIDISFKNPLLIVVFALIVAIFSLVAISKLPIDILPKFKTSAVQVLTLYPGMPAEVMEKDITSRIERWTGQAEGISRQESKTMIGVSVVRNFFREEIDPNTAMSHVTSFAMSDLYYLPPGTLPPMIMPYDPTASIPLALLTVSSEVKNEKELYDIAYFNLRNLLGGIQGIVAPAVYGGKLTRIYVYVDPDKLEARNLSATDVMEAIQADNVMIPTGDANIGNMNYSVNAKGMLTNVEDFDDIIIKWQDGAPIYVRDIGHTENAGAIQTNIVRVNGKRQVYIPIYKRPGANTIAAVEGVKSSLDQLKSRLDPSIELNVIFDQSSYVRKSINGLKRAGIEGLILVTLMLFVFLGNVRSALIVVLSLPLAIMFTFIAMYFTGETINSMTLGGIALAIGLLVDNAIVVLENTDRHLKMGKTANQAAMDAVKEVAMPVFASTLVIIIVFLPIIFLTGITKYLFSSLAISVTFAMVGSYIFSMTLVPIAAARFFKDRLPDSDVDKPKSFFGSMSGILDRPRELYLRTLKKVLRNKGKVLAFIFALLILSGFVGRNLGYELFPKMDVGQLEIYARLEPGTRLENTEEVIAEIEDVIIDVIGDELNIIVSNIGVFYDWPAAYTPNSGTQDAFIKVQLKKGYKTSTFDYVKILRPRLVKEFPGVELSFNTGGIVTAALNYGLPSPIDIQVIGNDLQVANKIAREIRDSVRLVRGTRDVRILQRLNQPSLDINIDRIKASEMGVNASSAVKNIVASLNSTTNFLKSFWINEVNGNHYFVGVTYPEYEIDNQTALENVIITGQETTVPVRLKNIATITRGSAPTEINHLNINRVTDIYANVEDRDIGSVSAEIKAIIDQMEDRIPDGYEVRIRGEIENMQKSFSNLGLGLVLAVILAFLVIVPLFRSFKLPLIIILTVPLGLIGVVWMLFLTNTNINIQSLMGVIMMIGIAVSFGNLLVDRINRLVQEGKSVDEAIMEGAASRFRPIIMVMLANVFALLPMSLGLETGGEANIPLARAILGGVTVSALLALFIIPVLYRLFTTQKTNYEEVQENIPN